MKTQTTINTQQFNSLKIKIFNFLMSLNEIDMAEMGEAIEEAEKLAASWVTENNILITD